MKYLGELITRTARVLGDEQTLASKIDVPEDMIREWAAGKVKCEPQDVALIASAGGYDPVAWFVRASLARHAGSPRGHLLHEALFRVVASDHRGAQFLWASHRHRSW